MSTAERAWPQTPDTPPPDARLVADIVDVRPDLGRGVRRRRCPTTRSTRSAATAASPGTTSRRSAGLLGDNPLLQFVDSPGFWVVTVPRAGHRGRPRPGAVLVRAGRHLHAVADRGEPGDVPPDDAEHGPPAAHAGCGGSCSRSSRRGRSSGCGRRSSDNAGEILDDLDGRVRPRDHGLGRDAAAGARRPVRHAARGPPPHLRVEQRAARRRQPRRRGPARRRRHGGAGRR